jgi:hypothetical protein
LAAYWRQDRFVQNDFSLRQNLEVAALLRSESEPNETVFIWGFEPLINFVAHRKTSSRYIYNFPFMIPEVRQEDRILLMDELNDSPPDIFILSSRDAVPWASGTMKDSRQAFMEWPALVDYVESGYQATARIGRFLILRRIE